MFSVVGGTQYLISPAEPGTVALVVVVTGQGRTAGQHYNYVGVAATTYTAPNL